MARYRRVYRKPEPEAKPTPLTDLSKADLQALASAAGLETTGTKAELIGRLEIQR